MNAAPQQLEASSGPAPQQQLLPQENSKNPGKDEEEPSCGTQGTPIASCGTTLVREKYKRKTTKKSSS
jgi:hypothetical protein